MNVKYVITGIKVAISTGMAIMMVKVAEPAINKFCNIKPIAKKSTIPSDDIAEEQCQ